MPKLTERGLKKAEKLARRIKTLEAFILALLPGMERVDVQSFRDVFGGWRIAEISATYGGAAGGGGCAWMRADGGDVIFAAEEFVLTAGIKKWRPAGWQSEIDDHGDARSRLRDLIVPPKKIRRKA